MRAFPALLVVGSAVLGCVEPAPVDTAASRLPSVAILTLAQPGPEDPASELAAGVAMEVVHHLVRDPRILARPVADPRTSPIERMGDVAARTDADVVVWVGAVTRDGARMVSWRADSLGGAAMGAHRVSGISGELAAVPARIAAEILAGIPDTGRAVPIDTPAWPVVSDPAVYARFLRALARISRGSLDEGARVVLLDSLPESIRSHPPAAVALGAARLDLAGRLGGAGDHYERAEEAIRQAFRLDSAYPPARRLLAAYLAKRGRAEESVALLQEGLERYPDYPGFHEQLGYVLRYGGSFRESIERYRRAQELDGSLGNMASTHDQITKAHIYLGDYAEALASHERAEAVLARLGREPDEKEWFYRGIIHLYAGDSAKALEAFGRGATLDSASVWTQLGRGYEAIVRRDSAAVATVLDSLERRVVVDGERHYRLVHLATFLGDADRALGHLTTAVRGGFFAVPYLESDPLTASLREHEEFRRLIGEARARRAAFGRAAAPPDER